MFILFLLIVFIIPREGLCRIYTLNLSGAGDVHKEISTFGFSKGGNLNISVSKFIYELPENEDSFIFTLHRVESFDYLANILREFCPLNEEVYSNSEAAFIRLNLATNTVAVNFNSRWNLNNGNENFMIPFFKNVNITLDIKNEGTYALYFHSCCSSPNKTYEIEVTVTEKNLNNYLSSKKTYFPIFYATIGTLHTILFLTWSIYLCLLKKPVCKVHILMAITVFFKLSLSYIKSSDFLYVNTNGKSLTNWYIVEAICSLFQNTFFFITLFSIAIGSTIVKKRFSFSHKISILILIIIQISQVLLFKIFYKEKRFLEECINFFTLTVFIILPLIKTNYELKIMSTARFHRNTIPVYKIFTILIMFGFYSMYLVRIIIFLFWFEYYFYTVFYKEILEFVFYLFIGVAFRQIINNVFVLLSMEDDSDVEEELVFAKQTSSDHFSKIVLHSPKLTTNLVKQTTSGYEMFKSNNEYSDFTI